MATQIIKLSNGAEIHVEVQAPPHEARRGEDGFEEMSGGKAMEIVTSQVGEMKAVIEGLAKDLHAAVQSASPDQVEVEVGLEIKLGGSVWLASADGKANVKLKLGWKKAPVA